MNGTKSPCSADALIVYAFIILFYVHSLTQFTSDAYSVMGDTGSGKSRFINLVTGSNLPVSSDARSCTQEFTAAGPIMLDGRQVYLFDTPGFDNTEKSGSDILRSIGTALANQYRQGHSLHGIIYLHRISDVRVGASTKSNFQVFRKLCGEEALEHVVILTNMWSKIDEMTGYKRASELSSMTDFFGGAMMNGAIMEHNNPDTVESAHKVIRHILGKPPVVLDIQREIVDDKLDISRTSAGMVLDDKLDQLAKWYEQKLKDQLNAAEAAWKERDDERRTAHEEEAQRAGKLLEKLRQEKRQLAAQCNDRRQEIEQLEAASEEEAQRTGKLLEKLGQEKRQLAVQCKKLQQEIEQLETRVEELESSLQDLETPSAEPEQDDPESDASEEVDADGKACIVSGQIYSLYNKQHGLYATVHGSHIRLEVEKGAHDNSQRWRFTSKDSNRWKIQSVRTGKFVWVNTSNTLMMHSKYWSNWCVASEEGQDDSEIRICLNSANARANVIALGKAGATKSGS
ncbi:hypothetical protein MD484_g6444, partial [Candolleomyces efflorescens]